MPQQQFSIYENKLLSHKVTANKQNSATSPVQQLKKTMWILKAPCRGLQSLTLDTLGQDVRGEAVLWAPTVGLVAL